jgi:hypothetical protein
MQFWSRLPPALLNSSDARSPSVSRWAGAAAQEAGSRTFCCIRTSPTSPCLQLQHSALWPAEALQCQHGSVPLPPRSCLKMQ